MYFESNLYLPVNPRNLSLLLLQTYFLFFKDRFYQVLYPV